MTHTDEYDDNGVLHEAGSVQRKDVASMSDRELLEEMVHNQRTVTDIVEELAESPMVKQLSQGGNPIMAMMRGGRE